MVETEEEISSFITLVNISAFETILKINVYIIYIFIA